MESFLLLFRAPRGHVGAGEGRVRRGHVARPDGEARQGGREREGEGPERLDHGHDEAECAPPAHIPARASRPIDLSWLTHGRLACAVYDDGDDQMKKTLGEAMLKSQTERMGGKPAGMGDF